MKTRRVGGFSGATSQFAKSSRVGDAVGFSGGKTAGVFGDILFPFRV